MISSSNIEPSGHDSLRRPGWFHHRPPLLHMILLYAVYFLTGGFGQGLALIPGVAIIFWPPVGILLATLLLHPRGSWPWWIIAGGLAELTCNAIWFHNPLPFALIYYTANALEVLTAAWLIHRFAARPFRLRSLNDVLAFVILGAGVAPLVSATIIAVTDAMLGKHPFTTAWPLVWLGDGSGLLISAPLTFTLVQAWRDRGDIPPRRILEAVIVGLLLLGIGALAFRGYLPTAYVLLPPLLWAAARFQLQGATVAVGIVTLITAMFTITGKGEFAGDPEAMHEKLVMLQIFLSIAAVSTLLVGVLSLQREQAQQELRTANDDLERQVAEQTADLRVREADLRLTVDAVPALIAYVNEQYCFRWVNGHFRRWFGLEPWQVEGRRVHEILGESVWEVVQPYMARALAGETVTYESYLPYITEPPKWVNISYTPDLDSSGHARGFIAHVVDISDRRQAELNLAETVLALARERKRLSLALHTGGLGAYEWNVNENTVWWSEELYPLFGVDPATFTPTVESFNALVHSDDLAEIWEKGAEALAQRVLFEMEYRVVRPDGETRWFYNRSQVETDTAGERVTGVLADITARKEAETRLRANELRYRTLVDGTSVVTWSCSESGLHVEPQPAWMAFTGQSAEEMLGMGWLKAIHPDDASAVVALWNESIAQSKTFKNEHRIRRYDGQWRWMSVYAVPIQDAGNQVIEWFGMNVDITERKQAEEQLRRNSKTFSTLIEQSPFGIYTVDSQFRIAQVSIGSAPAFRNVQPLIGRDFGEVMRILWPEPSASEIITIFRHTLETGESYISAGLVETRKDLGSIESYEWQTHQVTLGDGRHGVVCYFFDSTRLREAERKISEQAEMIANESRSKDEFLAMLSHELRNPLASISTAMHLLRTRMDGNEDAAIMQAYEIIERQGVNLNVLVSDLLEVSRIVSGRIRLEQQIVDLNQIVAHAVATSAPLFAQYQHNLVVNACPEQVWVSADATRLEQVFINILNNAAKYTSDGGKVEVWIEQDKEADSAMVRIRDNGAGIDKDLLPHIFELYTQAGRSLASSAGGLGIGLSLASRLVEMHGGTIEAHSPPQAETSGSEFIVTLATTHPPEIAATIALDAPLRTEGLRVLIVDDNVDLVHMLSTLLQSNGHSVQVAYNGPDGIESTRVWMPDIVLLDIGLPGQNGFEVARCIRAAEEPDLRRVPLIAVSGYGRGEDKDMASEAGFDAYITKPYDFNELERLMASLIQQRGVAVASSRSNSLFAVCTPADDTHSHSRQN